jgi:hypothetical protein
MLFHGEKEACLTVHSGGKQLVKLLLKEIMWARKNEE